MLGIVGHMMNSIIIGIVFIVIARAAHLRGVAAVIAGMMWGLIVYGAMYWALLRGVLASTSASFLSANPEWSWIAAHLMYGVVLGAVLAYGPLRHSDLEPGGRPVLADQLALPKSFHPSPGARGHTSGPCIFRRTRPPAGGCRPGRRSC